MYKSQIKYWQPDPAMYYIKKVINHGKVRFISGKQSYVNIRKSFYHYHFSKIKEEKHMNISINVEKGFDMQQEEFMILNNA